MDYMKNITKEDIKNKDFISNYARTNKFEFVAEAFCQGTLSKKYGKYTGQVMEAIKEHFGKNYQTKLALNEKDKEEQNDNEMWIEGYGYGYPIDEEEYNKFQEKVEKLKKEDEKKENKVNNGKDNAIMAVMDELKNFILSVVNNEDDKDEKKDKVENEDKRKLIDEVGGILKGKVDEEVWRTVIGKLEKIAYNPSETDKADNKCKNEDDEEKEEKEEKYEEMKEIANKKAKNEEEKDKEDKKEVNNSMDKIKEMIIGGNSKTELKSSYVSQDERLKLGDNY